MELAATPTPFDVPNVTGNSEAAAADWQAAADLVTREGEAKAVRRAAGNGSGALNKATLAFIRDGAGTGDRHRLLFSAAANLAEFHCPLPLAVALLEESALTQGCRRKTFGAYRMRTVDRRHAFTVAAAATGFTRADARRLGRLDSQGTAGSCRKRSRGPCRGIRTGTGRTDFGSCSTLAIDAGTGTEGRRGAPGRRRAASAAARGGIVAGRGAAAGPAAADTVTAGGRRLGAARKAVPLRFKRVCRFPYR